MKKKRSLNPKNAIGLSLIEILIVLTIVSFFAFMALPGINHFFQSNQAITQVNQLITALHYARSEAIVRHEIIIFCPSQNQIQCSNDWHQGQIIITTSGIVLQVYPALNAQTKLIWKSTFANNEKLSWLPSGFTAGQSGSFFYCPADLHYAKRIIVLRSGRIRVDADEKTAQLICASVT